MHSGLKPTKRNLKIPDQTLNQFFGLHVWWHKLYDTSFCLLSNTIFTINSNFFNIPFISKLREVLAWLNLTLPQNTNDFKTHVQWNIYQKYSFTSSFTVILMKHPSTSEERGRGIVLTVIHVYRGYINATQLLVNLKRFKE